MTNQFLKLKLMAMKVIVVILILILSTVPVISQGNLEILAEYSGLIAIPMALDDAGMHMEEHFEPLLVIRTQKAYSVFLDRLPLEAVSATSPAPKNEDPLLLRPKVDFSKHMLLVVITNALDTPLITSVMPLENDIVLITEFPKNIHARPFGTGTYSAALVKNLSGKVIIRESNAGAENSVGGSEFDSLVWVDEDLIQEGVRLKMADSLIKRRLLDGKTRTEIIRLLGNPTETSYFQDWHLIYWLGPERGFISIDSEWLVIRFGPDDKVTEYQLIRD